MSRNGENHCERLSRGSHVVRLLMIATVEVVDKIDYYYYYIIFSYHQL